MISHYNLILQNNIPHILHDVDFSKGESHVPEEIRKHPHREVPILTDGEYVIFEAYVLIIIYSIVTF